VFSSLTVLFANFTLPSSTVVLCHNNFVDFIVTGTKISLIITPLTPKFILSIVHAVALFLSNLAVTNILAGA